MDALEYQRTWRKDNKARYNELQTRWRNKDREAYLEYLRTWRKDNRERYRKAQKEARRKRYHSDPKFRLAALLRSRISDALGRVSKSASTLELLGCSSEELKVHLESLFQPGMSWQNYGEWHIDHRRPCASFDLTDPDQQRACFNWRNLQPLWALDNWRKGAKLY